MNFGTQEKREVQLSFVVFGPTGSGKTTLINYFTATDEEYLRLMKGGEAGVGTASKTTVVRATRSQINKQDEDRFILTFFDTPGHGANDEGTFSSGSLMAKTVKELMKETTTLNGVILLLKMERFRKDLDLALKDYIKMFQTMHIEKGAVLVVITHSLQYEDGIKEEFANNIFENFKDYVLEENVVHVNVCMLHELKPGFARLYEEAATEEMERFKRHLFKGFAQEYNIRHWFDCQRGLNDKIDEMFESKKKPRRMPSLFFKKDS